MSFEDVLKKVFNPVCDIGCNKNKRGEITVNDLCLKVNSILDQLPVRCVGEHGIRKIYFLYQYFGIFTTGMHIKWKDKINYVEICSGPGRCINRRNGDEFNGTALAVLEHPSCKYIKNAFFFDADEIVVNALRERINNRNINNAFVYLGDYNNVEDICGKLAKKATRNTLNLVFIDPTDCGIPFQLIRSMKEVVPNMDLIINIASRTDFNRNVENALMFPQRYKNSIAKYTNFLDGADFFKNSENIANAKQGNYMELRNDFRGFYSKNLEKIGYRYFRFNSIANFYDLLFATSHEKGIEFWKKATAITFNGQRKLF